MRRNLTFVLCLIATLALALPAWRRANNFLVRVQGSIPADLASQVAAAGGTLLRVYPEIGYVSVTSTDPNFAAKLRKSTAVQAVDPDLKVQWTPSPEGLQTIQGPEAASHTTINPAAATFYACQWNLQQIDAPAAWAQDQFGAPGIKVAVLDTGVDPFHVDLAGKIDPASTSMLFPGSPPCGAFDEGTIFDLNFHGSFVSGIIAANGINMAGVAPLTTIVGVKVLDCGGSGSFGEIISGILYAANLPGVEVINMSLTAGFSKNLHGAGPLVAAMNKAVNYAESQGKLVVSASGNNGFDMDHDGNIAWVPAQSGSGIGIYATNNLDGLAAYSNHGVSGTWLGAPGGGFPNTAPPLPGCPLADALEGFVLSVCSVRLRRSELLCGRRRHQLRVSDRGGRWRPGGCQTRRRAQRRPAQDHPQEQRGRPRQSRGGQPLRARPGERRQRGRPIASPVDSLLPPLRAERGRPTAAQLIGRRPSPTWRRLSGEPGRGLSRNNLGATEFPPGPTGRETVAQGCGRRPMPWVTGPRAGGLKGRERFARNGSAPGVGSRGPSGRPDRGGRWTPGNRPAASSLGWVCSSRPVGRDGPGHLYPPWRSQRRTSSHAPHPNPAHLEASQLRRLRALGMIDRLYAVAVSGLVAGPFAIYKPPHANGFVLIHLPSQAKIIELEMQAPARTRRRSLPPWTSTGGPASPRRSSARTSRRCGTSTSA